MSQDRPPTSPPTADELRAQFAANLDQAEWAWLASHCERDSVILVQAGTPLIEAAVAVALDDTAQVGRWIQEGKLAKPSSAQLDTWRAEPAKRFQILVVAPYVLAQELLS